MRICGGEMFRRKHKLRLPTSGTVSARCNSRHGFEAVVPHKGCRVIAGSTPPLRLSILAA